MRALRSSAQEAAEDLFFGQIVIIWARWFVVVAGIGAALWTSDTAGQLTNRILPIVALMAMNLFLHGRYLVERPANQSLLLLASLLDLALISGVVGFWGDGGLANPYFVFYYPMLFAVAVVVAPVLAAGYGVIALIAYAGTCLVVDGGILSDSADLKRLTMRLITLAAMAGLGAYYWRVQRERRHATTSAAAVADLPTRYPVATTEA